MGVFINSKSNTIIFQKIQLQNLHSIFFNVANLSSHVTESSRLIGYAVALSGAVVQSLTFVMVRKVGGSVSFYTNVFYFGWCSALLSGLTMFVFQKPVIPDCGTTRWFLIGVGRDAFSFQISKEEIIILQNRLDRLGLVGFMARYLWRLLSFLNHKQSVPGVQLTKRDRKRRNSTFFTRL